jgi:hypothetical protein
MRELSLSAFGLSPGHLNMPSDGKRSRYIVFVVGEKSWLRVLVYKEKMHCGARAQVGIGRLSRELTITATSKLSLSGVLP